MIRLSSLGFLLVLGAVLLAEPVRAAPDFADGLAGGPDVWEVTGIAAGETLDLRAKPSPRAKILARFANGALLANRSCAMRKGERWCRVAPHDTGKPEGWVRGRNLREYAPR